MKIRSFREITLISFRDVTSKAFSWKRSICLWQTFREIRVWSQGLVQKRKAIVKKSFCSLTLLFCKHINESTLWSASNNILWPWYSEILEFSEAERFTLISRNILRQNYSSHLNFYSIFTLSKSNNRMNCFKKQLRYNFPMTYSNVTLTTSSPEGIKQLCLHILRSHWAEKEYRTRSEKWRMHILLLAVPIGKE